MDVGDFEIAKRRFAKLPQTDTNMIVIYNNAVAKGIRAELRTFVSGRNSYLLETCGLPPEALAHLMAQWKERTLKT